MTLLVCTVGLRCDMSAMMGPAPTDLQAYQVLAYHSDGPPLWDGVEQDEASSADSTEQRHVAGAVDNRQGSSTAASSPKADWIREADEALATRFERIEGFLWFNFNKERDWRVNSSPAALNAFRQSWSGLEQGVFLPDFPGPAAPNTSAIDAYETLVGGQQARIGWHVALTAPFPAAAVELVQQRGSGPYIVWEPYDPTITGQSAYTGASLLPAIVDGLYDAHITQWAQAAAANGQPIEIAFGHEMNSNWYTWGCLDGHNGNTPALFVAAYRHVHRLFEAAGATNVRWVWTINASWRDDFTAAFPGEAYVDRLGLNGFNFGGDPEQVAGYWESWRSFEAIFGCWSPDESGCFSSYDALVELADLPILVSEFASAEWAGEPAPGD